MQKYKIFFKKLIFPELKEQPHKKGRNKMQCKKNCIDKKYIFAR